LEGMWVMGVTEMNDTKKSTETQDEPCRHPEDQWEAYPEAGLIICRSCGCWRVVDDPFGCNDDHAWAEVPGEPLQQCSRCLRTRPTPGSVFADNIAILRGLVGLPREQ